jgi:CYTH domain-containing protein
MALEIERKFLVRSDEYKQLASPVYFKQAYLNDDPERVVRIRVANNKGFLTIKGKNQGITRTEYEYEIPETEAQQILDTMALPTAIEKYRYTFMYKDKKWEVDEFIAENKGLVIAEIELESVEEIVEKPSWIGMEVSEDKRYYNSNLSKLPYCKWK